MSVVLNREGAKDTKKKKREENFAFFASSR